MPETTKRKYVIVKPKIEANTRNLSVKDSLLLELPHSERGRFSPEGKISP